MQPFYKRIGRTTLYSFEKYLCDLLFCELQDTVWVFVHQALFDGENYRNCFTNTLLSFLFQILLALIVDVTVDTLDVNCNRNYSAPTHRSVFCKVFF